MRFFFSFIAFISFGVASAQTESAPLEPMAPPAKEQKSYFFPDWPAPKLDFSVSPVLGVQFTHENKRALDITTSTQTLELGVQGGLYGVPLVQGNPGLYIEPFAGYVYGMVNRSSSVTSTSEEAKENAKALTGNGSYNRFFGGASAPIYYNALRQTFKLAAGTVASDFVEEQNSLQFKSDTALLVVPFVSTHYTYSASNLYGATYDKRTYTEHDNWLHARIFTTFLDAYFDFGPGYTQSRMWSATPGIAHADVNFTYLRGRTGMEFFSWLVGDAEVKYIIMSDKLPAAEVVRARFPTESLNVPSSPLSPPVDSVLVTAFLGVPNVFGGVGIGWRYDLQIYSFSEKNGASKEVKSDSSIGIVARATF